MSCTLNIQPYFHVNRQTRNCVTSERKVSSNDEYTFFNTGSRLDSWSFYTNSSPMMDGREGGREKERENSGQTEQRGGGNEENRKRQRSQ